MGKAIEIVDGSSSGFFEILSVIGDAGEELTWSFLNLDGEWYEAVGNAPNGLILPWKGLPGFVDWYVRQPNSPLMWCVLVGCASPRDIPHGLWPDLGTMRSPAALYESSQVVIEELDGCSWRVYAADGELIDRISQRFDGLNMQRPPSWTQLWRRIKSRPPRHYEVRPAEDIPAELIT